MSFVFSIDFHEQASDFQTPYENSDLNLKEHFDNKIAQHC